MPSMTNFTSFTAQPTAHPRHRSILAERFKTKPCQNYERSGICPYEDRCMFAHGAHDLRTPQANVADGLTTEDAINAFVTSVIVAKCLAKGSPNESAVLLQHFLADHGQTTPNTILAERFKTKMCASFEQHGTCHYGAFCMFAHDRSELRSTRLNLADNLVTLEAVRAFQHCNEGAAAAAAKEGAAPAHEQNLQHVDASAARRKPKRRGGRRVQEHRRASAQASLDVSGDSPKSHDDAGADHLQPVFALRAPMFATAHMAAPNSLDDVDSTRSVTVEVDTPTSMYCLSCGCTPPRRGAYQHNPYAPVERLLRRSNAKVGTCSCSSSRSSTSVTQALPSEEVSWSRSSVASDACVVSFRKSELVGVPCPTQQPAYSPLAEAMGHRQQRR